MNRFIFSLVLISQIALGDPKVVFQKGESGIKFDENQGSLIIKTKNSTTEVNVLLQTTGIGVIVAGVYGKGIYFEGLKDMYGPLVGNNNIAIKGTMVGLGLFTMGAGFSHIVQAAQIPPTSQDHIRQVKQTKFYKALEEKLGARDAESFVLDVFAGFSFEGLIKKYITDASEKAALLKLASEIRGDMSPLVNNLKLNEKQKKILINGLVAERVMMMTAAGEQKDATKKAALELVLSEQRAKLVAQAGTIDTSSSTIPVEGVHK